MADEDELELDTEKPKSGGKGKIILLLVGVILLISGSVIGVLYFTGMLSAGDSKKAEVSEKTEAHVEEKHLEVKPAEYLDLSPAFVVNFQDQTRATYLQVEMQVMAREKSVLEEVKLHMPLIRNDILLILSAQNFDEVKTRQGKEKLQQVILEKIRTIVDKSVQTKHKAASEKGEIDIANIPNIEQVYFTSFIMQ